LAGLLATGQNAPLLAGEFTLPAGPNRDLVYGKCRECHDLQYVVDSKGLTPDAWSGLLDDMESFGVVLTPDDRQKIQTYLVTYMSSNPPPAPSTKAAAPVDAQQLFIDNCSACHQVNGAGIPGTFPALAKNHDLFLARDFPVMVVLYGMSGKIIANGDAIEGEMPSFGHLTDAQISAILNYVRSHFSNVANTPADMAVLTAKDIKAARSVEKTQQQVFSYRASLQ